MKYRSYKAHQIADQFVLETEIAIVDMILSHYGLEKKK